MARADIISKLYSSQQDMDRFDYNRLTAPPLFSMITYTDVMDMEQILADPRLVTKLKDRLKLIDQILGNRKFYRMTQGTNRAVYKFLEDQSIVLKTAISKPGIHDSYYEYYNQEKIKPFVAKCFETVPSGIVGLFERVQDITSKEQFMSIAPDVFKLLNDHILGKYVMADIGSRFFRNYGIRLGFGPVILDYPMLYELDGNKLYCNAKDPYTGMICDGPIDYDNGFNYLHCKRCGKQYLASELAKSIDNNEIIITGLGTTRGKSNMKITFSRGGQTLATVYGNGAAADVYVSAAQYQQMMQNGGSAQQPATKQPKQQQSQKRQVNISARPKQQQSPFDTRGTLTLVLSSGERKSADINSVDGRPLKGLEYPDDEKRRAEEAILMQQQKEEEDRIIQEIRDKADQENSVVKNDPNVHFIVEYDTARVKRYLQCLTNDIDYMLETIISLVGQSAEDDQLATETLQDIGELLTRFAKGYGGLIDDNFEENASSNYTEEMQAFSNQLIQAEPEQPTEPERVEGEVVDQDPLINVGNPTGIAETYVEPNKVSKPVTRKKVDPEALVNY